MLVNSSFLSGVHAYVARVQSANKTRDVAFHFLIISVSYVFHPRTVHHEQRSAVLESATRLGWIQCRMITSRGSVKTELTSCSKEFSHQDQDQM